MTGEAEKEADMAEENGVEVVMTLQKETERTKRYREVVEPDDEPVVGDLYVPKRTLKAMGNPTRIRVTVRPDR